MAWIEVHQELAGHRKTRQLARTLGISRPQAVGHLVCLWLWALDHAGPSGELEGFEPDDLAEESGWAGDAEAFVAALREVGYLDGSTIHDWPEYTGRLIAQREANRDRKRRVRALSADGPRTGAGRHGATRPNTTEPDRRTSTYTPEFEAFWAEYPNARRQGKGKAAEEFGKALRRAPLEAVMHGLRTFAADPDLPFDEPRLIPLPATWLHQNRWEDGPLPSRNGRRDYDAEVERLMKA